MVRVWEEEEADLSAEEAVHQEEQSAEEEVRSEEEQSAAEGVC
jgi:hypothetical protein